MNKYTSSPSLPLEALHCRSLRSPGADQDPQTCSTLAWILNPLPWDVHAEKEGNDQQVQPSLCQTEDLTSASV